MNGVNGGIISGLSIQSVAAGVAVVLFSAILYSKTWPPASLSRRILLGALRAAAFLLLLTFIVNPLFVSVTSESRRPILPVLLDVSRSMGIADQNGKTRIEAAVEASRLLPEIFEGADVMVIPFSAGVLPDSAEGGDYRAIGEGTDIVGAVMSVLGRFQAENLRSVIVISDGRVTRGMKSAPGAFKVPLHLVAVGERAESPDIRIDDTIYERTAPVGTRLEIETFVSVDGEAGDFVTVELLEGGRVVDSGRIETNGVKGVYGAALRYRPESEGEHRLTAKASGIVDEKITENNFAALVITAIKDKIDILMIDMHPDWDMAFIKGIVKRSERYDIEVAAWRPQLGYRLDGGDGNAEPVGIDPRYELVIVGDDRSFFRDRSNAESLETFVRNGGGVIFLACEYSPLLDRAAYGNLEAILPVRRGAGTAIETGEYYARPAVGSAGNQVAALFGASGAPERLPPLPAVISGLAPTAGAEVPLVAHDGKPLLAISRYGDGVAAVLLGFPVWRWKLAGADGEAAYNSLITGLVGYVCEGADSPAIRVETGRPVYRTGEKIEITALLRPDVGAKTVRGDIHSISGSKRELLKSFLFSPERGDAKIHRAGVEPLPAGEYIVAARAETNFGEILTGETGIVVEPVSAELVRTSRDQEFLRRLALASGGSVVELDEISSLSSSIDLREDFVEKRKARSVRASPVFFLLIAGLFSCEWILRKAWGMV